MVSHERSLALLNTSESDASAIQQMEHFIIHAITGGQIKIVEARGGKFLTPQESMHFHQQMNITEWYLSLPKRTRVRLRLEDQMQKKGKYVGRVLFHQNSNGSSRGIFPDLDRIQRAGLTMNDLTPEDLDYLRQFTTDASLLLFIADTRVPIQHVLNNSDSYRQVVADQFGDMVRDNHCFAKVGRRHSSNGYGNPGNGMMVNFTGIADGGISPDSYARVEDLLPLIIQNASALVADCMDHIKVTTRAESFVLDWYGAFYAYRLDDVCHWQERIPLSKAVETMTQFLRPESADDFR